MMIKHKETFLQALTFFSLTIVAFIMIIIFSDYQSNKTLFSKPSPYLVLPWLELLIKIESLAFSQSTWLLCSPFGILQFILKNTNEKMMTLTSNFRYLQFYQPMVLNSLVVSLIPVAILSLQVFHGGDGDIKFDDMTWQLYWQQT